MIYRLLAVTLLFYATQVLAQPIVACGHPFYPPVSWHYQGKLIGLAPEVTQRLFSSLGYQVKFDAQGNWGRCLRELALGNADVAVAAYRIASREPFLVFPRQHLIADPVRIFVNADEKNIPLNLNQLKGKNVGLLLGDSFGETLDHFFKQQTHIQYVSRGQQNFEKLIRKRIDFFPLGTLSGQLQSERLGLKNKVKALSFQVATEFYYLAIRRGSGLEIHLDVLSQKLTQMHRKGEIKRLTVKYSQQYIQQSQGVGHGE